MRSSRRKGLVRLALACSLPIAPIWTGVSDLSAQNRVPSAAGDWMLRNLRPTGQPVIPLFDGWYANPDGTFELCFGYHNLNTVQAVDIPLGMENRIEPARFDGVQPTHFDEVPEEYRRRFCVFTVNLTDLTVAPEVIWTLELGGRAYSVPGSASEHYRMDEIRQSSRGNSAPLVRFEEPSGQPEGRGRRTRLEGGETVSATTAAPLPLSITVSDPEGIPLGVTRLIWGKHQGPGSVVFAGGEETEIIEATDTLAHATTATFAEPGDYVLRVQAVDWDLGNAFGYHCCWTNRYLRVSVR